MIYLGHMHVIQVHLRISMSMVHPIKNIKYTDYLHGNRYISEKGEIYVA
jgi:hypothetical protein